MEKDTAYYNSPVGWLKLTASEQGLTGLAFCAEPPEGEPSQPQGRHSGTLKEVIDWLDAYFAGKNPPVSNLRLSPAGSEFAQMVYTIMLRIPYATTTTYGEIAREIASATGKEKMSAQAVGGAVARNPIAIIIPCHRVIGADSKLRGYGGGIPTKQFLLELEGFAVRDGKVMGLEDE